MKLASIAIIASNKEIQTNVIGSVAFHAEQQASNRP